jgi:hypothetical protein
VSERQFVTCEEAGWSPLVVLPPFWRLVQRNLDGGKYLNDAAALAAIVSVSVEPDGKRWVHLSVSHRARLPSWRELRECKDLFLGRGVYAYQVLPPEDRYVNIHPRVLHLWHCLDGDPLPEFSGFLADGQRSI